MIVLWLLVAHLAGDYLFQTRWQAVGKFGWTPAAVALRGRHVIAYQFCFVPILAAYLPHNHGVGGVTRGVAFLLLLSVAHFLTDAQRFTRTPGEWIVWRVLSRERRIAEQQAWLKTEIPVRDTGGPLLMPPNPWPTIGLAIDQTLHLIQIAVLAEVFLR